MFPGGQTMNRKLLGAAIAGALSMCSLAASAQDYRYEPNSTYRLGRAPDWNPAAEVGTCHLRISVDDRATVQLRGDQVIVNTRAGKRSFDQGSVCTQPLPLARVDDFRVTANQSRGRIVDVRDPTRRNDYTGTITIEDPQPGSSTYDLVVSWRNLDRPPLAANDPFPFYDETRACQERVRSQFLSKNEEDAYLEFTGMTERDDAGPGRERISGRALARNRTESRFVNYECVLNDRTNRVVTASYDLRGPARYSSLQ
jgi:hypothetical protein